MVIIEIARYRLRPGADETALIQAEKEIQNGLASRYDGSLGRELGRGPDGEFVLIMRWASQEAAEGWNSALFKEAAGRTLGQLVDPSTMQKETLSQVAP